MNEGEIERDVLLNMITVIVLIVAIIGTLSQVFLMWAILLAFVGGFGYMYTMNRLFKGVFYGVPEEFLTQFKEESKRRSSAKREMRKRKTRKTRK